MLLSRLNRPISIIDLEDCEINLTAFLEKTAGYYSEFEWDQYLYRQTQIEFIKKEIPLADQVKFSDRLWLDYYVGKSSFSDLDLVLEKLSNEKLETLLAIKPTRKRAVSEFELSYKNGWSVERVSAKKFGQKYAVISDDKSIDYRRAERVFSELPEEKTDKSLLVILRYLAEKIANGDKSISKFNVVVHYTKIICYPGMPSTNAPEGIHQDGMDYIVSALVVERNNIEGGKSIIYGNDKRTPILEMELKPGQGILQPDRGSELWHTVTPVTSKNGIERGTRSTIGFDFTII